MMTDRRSEILRRAGKDPVMLDTRPLSVIMNDCIPYERWERELKVVKRAGYDNWIDLLTDRRNAKKNRTTRNGRNSKAD